MKYCWPCTIYQGRYPEITDGFQLVATKDHRAHEGVDIMLPRLKTEPVDREFTTPGHAAPPGWLSVACGAGTVVRVAWDKDLGLDITIKHVDGDLSGIWSYYAHQKEGSAVVKVGDSGSAGDPLGLIWHAPKVGHAVAHLHFGMYRDAWGRKPISPVAYLGRWKAVTQR